VHIHDRSTEVVRIELCIHRAGSAGRHIRRWAIQARRSE
jgi:hypothetical protein